MNTDKEARLFAEDRHRQGKWNTRGSAAPHFLARFAANYISFKRKGVDTLASRCGPNACGLDIGCGNGAYAQWFCARSQGCVVALDWSFDALLKIKPPQAGRIMRVCADACKLPFREKQFVFFYSVDTLGHLSAPQRALDEALRTAGPGSPFFVHSECSDYRKRWPDSSLIRKLGADVPARIDGHVGLKLSADIYKILSARFNISSFFSPAGILGWLLGYPEKYTDAFRQARWHAALIAAKIFAIIKSAPGAGAALRFINATTNHIELFFGIVGGGSCFASGSTPVHTPEDGNAPGEPTGSV